MATYFLRVKHISRGKGSRATKAAAYRAGDARRRGVGKNVRSTSGCRRRTMSVVRLRLRLALQRPPIASSTFSNHRKRICCLHLSVRLRRTFAVSLVQLQTALKTGAQVRASLTYARWCTRAIVKGDRPIRSAAEGVRDQSNTTWRSADAAGPCIEGIRGRREITRVPRVTPRADMGLIRVFRFRLPGCRAQFFCHG
jgi:hypothetical protein